MSVRMMTLVWELDLPDSEKVVLLALADCANDEGHCWPGMTALKRKCSKSDRTVQLAIKMLCVKGHLSRREVPGKGCNYTVHPIVRFASDPRSNDTPEVMTPPKGTTQTPEGTSPTPEAASGKPSKNHKEPSKERRVRAPIPDNWMPKDFGEGSKSREIVEAWPADELEAQLEQFKANHRAKGNTFLDPQDAWQTWVLNTRKFGIGRPQTVKYVSASGYEYRGDLDSVQREARRRGDNDTYWQVEVDRKRGVQSIGEAVSRITRAA